MEHIIRILDDSDDLAHVVAKRWVELADQAIAQSGSFNVALSGGSSPRKLFQLLAQPEYSKQVQWQKAHIYFGDERAVPLDHDDSNYRMAKEALLDHVPVPESQVHPIYIDLDNIRESANHYAEVLRENIANKHMRESDGLPRFDLCLQGIGDDGHTASLFPGTEILNENE
ncbi:MAG: 6-phosphogluconolactonase, partial [Gammaproteobacteria bacterium]|nr:6-phosphogluconolactonase [Gammaproteobacteria bacterium]